MKEPRGLRRLWSKLGPGLISGIADDDPVAITTYVQTGVKYGYAFCWLLVLCFPIMAAVQEISARIGRATGQGLAANIRAHYPRLLLQSCVILLLVANTVAIGADLGAMSEVAHALIGGPQTLHLVLFAAICIGAEVFMSYPRYVAILRWSTISVCAYLVAVPVVDISWTEAGRGLLPHVPLERDYAMTIVAIFGVAISPYVFFWQSAQESEDQRVSARRKPLAVAPDQAPTAITRIRLDTYTGMSAAIVVALAIMLVSAATLHGAGITQVRNSAEAAQALAPLAGHFAFSLFALGILGTGLLAVPVLAGSAAYAIGEARGWPVGLSRRPKEAKAFYATIAISSLGGLAINFAGFDPMLALFTSAVINGIVAVPMLVMMILIASRRSIMGAATIEPRLRAWGWTAATLMAAGVLFTVATAV